MSDQEHLTPQQEREYVEAAWERVKFSLPDLNPDSAFAYPYANVWAIYDVCSNRPLAEAVTIEEAWHAAFLFTKEHEGELKRRRYAISLLKLIYAQGGQGEWKPVDWKQDQEALEQVIAREQAALADLLRGWREKGDGK